MSDWQSVDFWVTQFFIYLIIWWVALFVVLPFGVKRVEQPTAGHDPGAPANPHLKMKVLATTIVAAIIWGLYFIYKQYAASLPYE